MSDDSRPKDSPERQEFLAAGPSLADTDRGVLGPFGALVARASSDPEAAVSLASAYSELPKTARFAIAHALWQDSKREGCEPAPALLALLSIEDDLEVAEVLAEYLRGTPVPGANGAPRGFEAQEPTSQARIELVLVRPLYGEFVEALSIREEPVSSEVVFTRTPISKLDFGDKLLRAGFVELPWPEAVDRLAKVLWSHRRLHGRLPFGLGSFRDLFA